MTQILNIHMTQISNNLYPHGVIVEELIDDGKSIHGS